MKTNAQRLVTEMMLSLVRVFKRIKIKTVVSKDTFCIKQFKSYLQEKNAITALLPNAFVRTMKKYYGLEISTRQL